MRKKGVLGKGLDALIPAEEEREEGSESDDASGVSRTSLGQPRRVKTGEVAYIDLDKIEANPFQPRQDFDEDTLDELAGSIQQFGLIQPVTVRMTEEGSYEIISGERRVRAARRTDLESIPAYVRKADSEQMLEMALVENVQREDLNPIEEARGYQRLVEECGLTHEKVAEKVGKNRSTVSNFLRLLQLPPRIQDSLRNEVISPGHARTLVNLERTADQLEILDRIISEDLTVRATEKLVRQWRQKPAKPSEQDQTEKKPEADDGATGQPDRDTLQLKQFTDKLRNRFSTEVNIRNQGKKGGKIEIAYYGSEDLERILELLLD